MSGRFRFEESLSNFRPLLSSRSLSTLQWEDVRSTVSVHHVFSFSYLIETWFLDFRTPLRPPTARGGAAGSGGAGALGGLLGGLGGALTCLCCLSALGLIGLWATFIPFVAFFSKFLSAEPMHSSLSQQRSSSLFRIRLRSRSPSLRWKFKPPKFATNRLSSCNLLAEHSICQATDFDLSASI